MTQETTIINTFSNVLYSQSDREDIINLSEGNNVAVNINCTTITQEIKKTSAVVSVVNNQTLVQSLEQETSIIIKDNPITINISGGVVSSDADSNPYSFVEAGENIPAFRICYVRGNQAFVASNTMLVEYANLIQGVAVSQANSGDLVQIQLAKKIYNAGWNFVKGKPVFLGVNGNVTQILPENGLLCEIGLAIDTSMLFLDIEEPINLG